jgi:hypothetical protein
MPGVVDVQAAGPARAQATVIHLDFHLAPSAEGPVPGLIVTGKSRMRAEHLDTVEAVRTEHEAILRAKSDNSGWGFSGFLAFVGLLAVVESVR